MQSPQALPQIHKPVRRSRADRYMLLTLLGFAGSVVVTRVFLELTGYPQVGNRELHIAHVLWGGLLLFIAALLMLIFANRSTFAIGAIGGGIGVGLFIDEVGKFITKSNDYFYPAAAPIIYAFFLVTVMLYLQIARRKLGDPRSEMYAALDDLQDVIDHPLYEDERQELEHRLEHVFKNAQHPDLAHLAETLLDYLRSDAFVLRQHQPTIWERFVIAWHEWESRWVNQRLYRFILVVGLFIVSVPALLESISTLVLIFSSGFVQEEYIGMLISEELTKTPNELTWLVILVVLEGIVAIPSLIGALLLIVKQDQRGIAAAAIGLIISLTTVNLLVFYFDQFLSLASTLTQFVVLMLVLHYRHRFMPNVLPQPKGIDLATM